MVRAGRIGRGQIIRRRVPARQVRINDCNVGAYRPPFRLATIHVHASIWAEWASWTTSSWQIQQDGEIYAPNPCNVVGNRPMRRMSVPASSDRCFMRVERPVGINGRRPRPWWREFCGRLPTGPGPVLRLVGRTIVICVSSWSGARHGDASGPCPVSSCICRSRRRSTVRAGIIALLPDGQFARSCHHVVRHGLASPPGVVPSSVRAAAAIPKLIRRHPGSWPSPARPS